MKYTKKLYDLRTDNDLTQEDIARILKTSKQNYGRYENGQRKLSIEDLITLSKFYKVTTDYILGLEENKNYYSQTTIYINERPKLTNNETNIKKAIKKHYGKLDYEVIEDISEYLKITKESVIQIIENIGYPDIQAYIDLSEYINATLDEMLK